MRVNLDTRHFTKAERRFAELLKKHHVPFKAKVKLFEREVDFLIQEKTVVEIGDHPQDPAKNKALLAAGYSVIQLTNKELRESFSLVERHLLTNWIRV